MSPLPQPSKSDGCFNKEDTMLPANRTRQTRNIYRMTLFIFPFSYGFDCWDITCMQREANQRCATDYSQGERRSLEQERSNPMIRQPMVVGAPCETGPRIMGISLKQGVKEWEERETRGCMCDNVPSFVIRCNTTMECACAYANLLDYMMELHCLA